MRTNRSGQPWQDAGIERASPDAISESDENEYRPPFAIPRASEFERLGLSIGRELHGGHQSRVLLATESKTPRREFVVKLIDTSLVDRPHALARLQVRDRVSAYDDRVVPLVEVAGTKLNRIENCYVVVSPKIDGRFLDVSDRQDVERMGRALARLHQSLRLVQADLPVVAALRVGDAMEELQDNHQLLHGDFFSSNLLLDADGRLWIYDFDDCGYGPVEYELGNTLFMALFDTSPSLNQPSDDYYQFRHWLLGAYRASAEHAVSEMLINASLQARSDTLRYWLSHLDEAPIGIRNSSPSWQRHLRAFAGVAQR